MHNSFEKLKQVFKDVDCGTNHDESCSLKNEFSFEKFPHCKLDICENSLTKCAVLVILFRSNNEFNVLFTKRSLRLRNYPGEICYPGGKFDKKLDTCMEDTAFREAHEEIGLEKDNFEFVCRLCHFISPVGHYISPIICLLKHATEKIDKFEETLSIVEKLKPNPDEVECIFWLPFSYFLNSETIDQRFSFVEVPFRLDEGLSRFKCLLDKILDNSNGRLNRMFISLKNNLNESEFLYGINATILLFVLLRIDENSNFKLKHSGNATICKESILEYLKSIRFVSYLLYKSNVVKRTKRNSKL